MAVPLGATCNCSLCHIELRLLADLTLAEDDVFQEFSPFRMAFMNFRPFPACSRI